MTSAATAMIRVALLGNPNTGKSTLFNALSGGRQQTGNYPGVTVEKKSTKYSVGGRGFELIDLPGTYSLAPKSPDEMVTVDVLLGRQAGEERPDVVVCVVDASNLERNLYLFSQAMELKLPVVLALNMSDVAEKQGQSIDIAELSKRLQTTIIRTQAHRGIGISELKHAIAAASDEGQKAPEFRSPLPAALIEEAKNLRALSLEANEKLPEFLAERLILDSTGYLEHCDTIPLSTRLRGELAQSRERLKAVGIAIPAIEPISRYKWIGRTLDGVMSRPSTRRLTLGDKADAILTHRVWGTLVFIAVMIAIFQAVFLIGEPSGEILDNRVLGPAVKFVEQLLAEGPLRSLLTDGMIQGVGGVLVFLPQILVLFLFIAILEDCGYMARAAYLMDRLMTNVGLSGKSFIPLLSSFACAVPGIMATRTIENRRDRMVTILVAPLMSCSARLPVYTLLIGAFVPQLFWLGGVLSLQGLVMLAMYFVGGFAAVIAAWILKKTIFHGPTPPFVMELPAYKWPGIQIVTRRVFDSGWSFVARAGTLILAVSILTWAASYFPRDASALPKELVTKQQQLELRIASASEEERELLFADLGNVEAQISSEHLRNSYLGRMGRAIEPAVRPLGWDWRIACAAIASFPAREVIVATLGVIYNLGSDADEENPQLRDAIKAAKWDGTNRPVFSLATALSVMVFFALCAQCSSTLVVIWRETGSWIWPVFTFAYMTGLAYLGALVTFQVAAALGG
jgi:ferrous iron transport protein B